MMHGNAAIGVNCALSCEHDVGLKSLSIVRLTLVLQCEHWPCCKQQLMACTLKHSIQSHHLICDSSMDVPLCEAAAVLATYALQASM